MVESAEVARRGFSLAETFAALRHRNYRLFFAGQLVSLTGTWMQNVAQPWLVYQLTGSPLYLGIVSFASAVPMLLFALWAGVVADRVPKWRLLVVTQTAMMLLAFVLAADVFWGWVQPWHIVVLAFLLATANAFDAPARHAFVIEMVGRDDLTNAIALNSTMFNTARIIGPSLAGIALALVGAAWCFFLNGVSFLAVIAGLLLMQIQPTVIARSRASAAKQLREGLSYIWRNQTVRSLMGLVAVSNVFAMGYSALMPAFAKDVLGAGEVGLGLLMTSVGVGALVGSLLVAALGHWRRKGILLTMGNLVFPVMVLLLSISRALPLSMLILMFAGMGFMIQNAMANTLIQTSVPDELRGRVMSVYTLVFFGFFPVGGLIAGAMAQEFGVPVGAAFGGTIALGFGLFLLVRVPQIRRLE